MTDIDARQSGRSVTSKVVAILDAFSADTPRLSLQGLAERTGLPQSTTYRLACELVEWGGLERGSGGYQIGLRLWEIGELARRGEQLRDVALPFMHDLYDATHENVHLAVLDGREALYIEKISGRRAAHVVTRRGGSLPLHATGVGKVLLAYAPEELVSKVLSNDLKRYTPHTIVAPGQLRRKLSQVRRTGLAFAIEEMSFGSVWSPHPYSWRRTPRSPRSPSSSGRAARIFSGLHQPFGRPPIHCHEYFSNRASTPPHTRRACREAAVPTPAHWQSDVPSTCALSFNGSDFWLVPYTRATLVTQSLRSTGAWQEIPPIRDVR